MKERNYTSKRSICQGDEVRHLQTNTGEVKFPNTYQGAKSTRSASVAKTTENFPGIATPWCYSPEKNLEGRLSSGPAEQVKSFQERQKKEREEKMRRALREREEEKQRDKEECLLDRQAAVREREEKIRRAKKEYLLFRQGGAVSRGTLAGYGHQKLGEEKTSLAAQQDVVQLFTLSYDLERPTRQEKEREEKLRKVKVMLKGMKMKVMLPKLESTLKGKMLMRFRQEVGEILKEQSYKLNMPVL